MMTSRRTIGLGLAFAVLLFFAGCSEPGTVPTVKVTGTVTHNGQPVEGASVAFTPESGRNASGTTDASGKFTLSTFGTGDGAVPGKHVVTIADTGSDTSSDEDYSLPTATEARFPAKYADPLKSGFEAEVKEGETNDFTFDMKD